MLPLEPFYTTGLPFLCQRRLRQKDHEKTLCPLINQYITPNCYFNPVNHPWLIFSHVVHLLPTFELFPVVFSCYLSEPCPGIVYSRVVIKNSLSHVDPIPNNIAKHASHPIASSPEPISSHTIRRLVSTAAPALQLSDAPMACQACTCLLAQDAAHCAGTKPTSSLCQVKFNHQLGY